MSNSGADHPVIHINKKQALKLVAEVVKKCGPDADNGGRCTYSNDLNPVPNCAVGQALFIAGVPGSELVRMDLEDYMSVMHGFDEFPPGVFGFTLTLGAAEVFSAFQNEADGGASFGEAAKVARQA